MKVKKLLFSAVVLLLLGTWNSGIAAKVTPQADDIAKNVAKVNTPLAFNDVKQSLNAVAKPYERSLINSLKSGAQQLQIEKDIQMNSTPGVLVPQFTRHLEQLSLTHSAAEIKAMLTDQAGVSKTNADGGISGMVTIEGSTVKNDVLVIAFDAYGYYAGMALLEYSDSEYEISGLAAGSYYVLTWSQTYIDELYDNVPIPARNMGTWRNATTIDVNDAVVTGIDFDLQTGAKIGGMVYLQDGVTPLEYETVTFTVTRAGSPIPVTVQDIVTNTGDYSNLLVPATGDFKIHAYTDDPEGEAWYPNQLEWQNGQTVTINSYDDELTGIDFSLQPVGGETVAKGSISGTITATGAFFSPLLSIIVAYDATDMSFAGLGLALLGSYTIEDLPVGSYYLYADDYLSELFDSQNYMGEFYSEAHKFEDATTVQVLEEQETTGINFQLDAGASISGKITKEGGSALDSLLVIAINADVIGDNDEPFPADLGLGIAFTDLSGNYTFNGMPTGEYIIRTISDFYINLDLNNLDLDSLQSIVPPGKHKGMVVDEYYNDVVGLLQFAEATRVSVEEPNAVTGIDIELASGNYINGSITDAVSGEPVSNVLLVAVDDVTGFPLFVVGNIGQVLGMSEDELDLSFITPGTINEDGTYSMGPLPKRNYKIFALPGELGGKPYLPEFYDGKTSFYTADVVNLNSAEISNIDFTLDKGATIQGFVELGQGTGYVTGADSLQMLPVVVYDTNNGDAIAYDFVQFNGGFRVDYLPAGNYKVAALPLHAEYGVTYMGGGNTYTDAATKTVSLNFGQVYVENIVVEPASGAISGNIQQMDTSSPLSMITVVAFDTDGHIAGLGTSDFNILTNDHYPESGDYIVKGLRDGNYYLRTFSYTTFMDLVNGLISMINGAATDLELDALLAGDLDLGGIDLGFMTYADVWYPGTPVEMDLNIDEMLFKFLYYGISSMYNNAILPIYFPSPFYQSIPASAGIITVSGGSETGGVNFSLDETDLITILTDVEDENDNVQIPKSFQVNQNYPNPFNPSTTISFSLPAHSHVSVDIFDTLGRKINTLVNSTVQSGDHKVSWNGTDFNGNQVAAGLYFARVKTMEHEKTIKMLFVK